MYVDGVQRLTVNVRLPPVNETFSSLSIAAPPSYSKSDGSNNSISNSSLPRKLDPRRHGPVGGLAQTVPNYFSLPVALSSLKSAAIGDQTSGIISPYSSRNGCFNDVAIGLSLKER